MLSFLMFGSVTRNVSTTKAVLVVIVFLHRHLRVNDEFVPLQASKILTTFAW